MARVRPWWFSALFLTLFSLTASAQTLAVDEHKIRIETGNEARLVLPIDSSFRETVIGHVWLSFLDKDGKTVRSFEDTPTISPGSSIQRIPLPGFMKLDEVQRAHYRSLRLKYTLSTSEPSESSVDGIVAVSRIASEPFVLKVLTQRWESNVRRHHVDVFAQDPVSNGPVRNVDVEGTLTVERNGRDVLLKAIGRSDTSGYTRLEFDLPERLSDSSAELEIKAALGPFVRVVEESLYFREEVAILISTDKPIYQPGQKLRVRALVFDNLKKPLNGTSLDFRINDSGDTLAFQTEKKTSRFGEADIEWTIPENGPPGPYRIEVALSDGDQSESHEVTVSRYELPTFTVNAKSDRPYYLPHENAQVTVQADYLFARPVPRAHVKIVRELQHTWDYREQKWVTTEGEVVEGTSDGRGTFMAKLDLQSAHEELEMRRSSDYSDEDYAAYVTDPSTNRTEQRRFSVRISRFPIHLYLIGGSTQADGLPLEFYLSASYADGTPAQCDISIYQISEGADRSDVEPEGPALTKVRTNSYGVAKVSGLTVFATALNEWDRGVSLYFRADDGSGKAGERVGWFRNVDSAIRVRTAKTLYGKSDPIHVVVESSHQAGLVVLRVLGEGQVLYARVLNLVNGKASTAIPYSKNFKGDITVSAYSLGESEVDLSYDSRLVSFPDDAGLQLETKAEKSAYAPGDDVTVRFRVSNDRNLPQKSLLGLTVFDKAVEERARTDAEFGGYYSCRACPYFWVEGSLPGLARSDLNRIDRSHPIGDIELAAEVLLAAEGRPIYVPELVGEDSSDWPALRLNYRQLSSWETALRQLKLGQDYPSDEPALRALLVRVDPAFETLQDPWGNPYRLSLSVEGNRNVIKLISAGPDELFRTPDDHEAGTLGWPYFEERGEIIEQVIRDYHTRTGKYVRDLPTLKDELAAGGHDFEAWRDPLGRPYDVTFGISGTRYTVTIRSDKTDVWTAAIDYTIELLPLLDAALTRYYASQHAFPTTDAQFTEALELTPIPAERLMDPWGQRFYSVFSTETAYVDNIRFFSRSVDFERLTPVTRMTDVLRLRSAGPDGKEGTGDDFNVARFSRQMTEQSADEATPQRVDAPILQGGSGAIRGAVADTAGALIPGVTVKLTGPTGRELETVTDNGGTYLFRNLAPGRFEISLSLPGFSSKHIAGVSVQSGLVTTITSTLEVASMSTLVMASVSAEVSSAPLSITTKSGTFQSTSNSELSSASRIATPRLREYFPETLVWQPSLETRSDGTAEARFKLADTVTTWKVAAIASTMDGRIALAEAEIVSSQPFFIDHDPPKVLTQGDEIQLPVVVRSYLDQGQAITLTMNPESWFTALDSSSRSIHVDSGDIAKETFGFRATMPVKDGKQRVTALGSISDAIEKGVTVRPDGQEVTHTSSRLLRGTAGLDIHIPADALPGATSGELKIYPNLLSHVVDGIEAIMHRPYGCAEQVISSAYPSLMFLRYAKQSGRKPDALTQKALRYVQLAGAMLRGYQSQGGGISYWPRGEADLAVTAYAIQFLHDAGDFVDVDEDLAASASRWLLQHQRPDRSWAFSPGHTGVDLRDLALTGLLTRVLSGTELQAGRDREAVSSAIGYLKGRVEFSNEPYSLASLALAAFNSGDKETSNWALDQLERIVRHEGDSIYWELRANTPFYGWGLPGRLETTALAVRAFAAIRGTDAPLVASGLQFLLRNKDRFGIWYSTQATVNVLEALLSITGPQHERSGGSLEVFMNGTRVDSISLPAGRQAYNPIALDVSRYLGVGDNHIEVRSRNRNPDATLQFTETHYVAWSNSPDTVNRGELRLSVSFDRVEASIGDEITCHVRVERVAFRGYGMLLAEIGLPPGAEVDRKSLQDAVEKAGWRLYRYEVLPDHIVAYLWPEAGGTQFEFKFRARYGIVAKTPASILYDYYNPEAATLVKPTLFTIR